MDADYRQHYGFNAIKRSLAHFALGKTSRLITSLLVFVILARELPLDEYGVYISFQAVIQIVGIITAIGIQKALFRYLPELRATGNHIAAYRLLLGGMLLRTVIVSLLVVAILPLVPSVGRMFNFEDWAWLFRWYLLVGYVRLTSLWLSQCLESLLWQKESQYSLAIGGAVTAVMIVLFAAFGSLNLKLVVIAELSGEVTALALLIIGWVTKWRADKQRSVGDAGWWRANRSRAIRYGAWGFLLSQSSLLYGSAPNRLVAAHFLPVAEVALLGVADHLLNLMRRFLPTRMLMSMIRPLAIARFSAQGDFRAVAEITEFVYRINVILLVLPIVVLAVVGPPLMDALTDGKYGAAAYLLMGFMVVLIAEGTRVLVDLMVQALEKNPIFFWTNILQSASLLIAVPLLPTLGVWSFVIANLTGTVIANSVVILRLRKQGYAYNLKVSRFAWILAHAALASGLGWLALAHWHSYIGATLIIVGTYCLAMLVKPPLTDREKEIVLALMRGQRGRRSKRATPTPMVEAGTADR